MVERDKLLPCPFCGGEGEVTEYNSFWYKVGCSNNGCFAYITSPVFQTKEDAILAWNTRKPMERIVERLEEQKGDESDYSRPEDKRLVRHWNNCVDVCKEVVEALG